VIAIGNNIREKVGKEKLEPTSAELSPERVGKSFGKVQQLNCWDFE
jgi:hypothetical protein